MEPETTLHPHSPETDIDDGLVFKHATTLRVWGLLVAATSVVNFLIYAWYGFSLSLFGWRVFHGPTHPELTTLGAFLLVHALFFTAATVALFHGSRNHPNHTLTPWLLCAAVAVAHLLAAVPTLIAGHGAAPVGLWALLLLNPLTYPIALPVAVLLLDRAPWVQPLPRIAAGLCAVAVLVPVIATTGLSG